jgi:hypothetical protein
MTGYAFAAVFFVALALAFIRNPRYGMYAYMAAFYVHPPSRWWGATLPDFRWSLLASAVVLLAVMRHPANPHQPPWHTTVPGRLMIAFTALTWIENLWALDSAEAMHYSILYTKYLLLFYFIYRVSDTEENVRQFLVAHILGCLYLGYLAYGTPVSSDRLDGVGGPGINDSNTLGMQFATMVPCGAMLVLVERNWRTVAAVLALAFSLNGLVLCGSRGAFLAVVLGAASLLFTYPKQHRKLFYVYAGLGVTLFLIVASGTFWNRMNTMKGAVDETAAPLDNSAESRLYIIQGQLAMFATHPWGTGHRGTVVLSRQYIATRYLSTNPDGTLGGRASHNSFMTALTEHGLAGAIIFIWAMLWARKAAKETRRLAKDSPGVVSHVAAVYGALVVVLVAGLFADFMAVEVTVWMLAALASMHGIAKSKAIALTKEEAATAPQSPALAPAGGVSMHPPRA